MDERRDRPLPRRSAIVAFGIGVGIGLGALMVGSGCGRVHDLDIGSEPLLTVHGHVEVASLTRVRADVPLIGVVAWAAVPGVNPVCLPTAPALIAEECPDPYGFVIGELSPGVPLDANGDFDVTLYDLPKIALSVGDQATRIAYGALLVVEDIDGDGQPSFPKTLLRTNRQPFVPPTIAPDDTTTTDRIVASSFSSLHAPQQRLVFREGGFVAPSFFYQACDWSTKAEQNIPPPGFSVLVVPARGEHLPSPDACQGLPIETRVNVAPVAPDEGLALICRPVQEVESLVRQPRADRTPGGTPRCLDARRLATVFTGVLCPALQSYALAGCPDDPGCPLPQWDLTASPPDWWPCP